MTSAPDDLLIAINYTRILPDYPIRKSRTVIYLGFNASSLDIMHNSMPAQLYPGSHLYGTLTYLYKDSFANSGAAAFGIPHVCKFIVSMSIHSLSLKQYQRSIIANIQSIGPDPLIPSGDNSTATLRLIYQDWLPMGEGVYKVEQDYSNSTVLNGFSLLGGVWTFINGLFAAIFGSSLLLVLFGTRILFSFLFYTTVDHFWNRYQTAIGLWSGSSFPASRDSCGRRSCAFC